MYSEITKCRISESRNLLTVLDLGHQALTGVFPMSRDQEVEEGPLRLTWCPDSGLLQLQHSFTPEQMYGENYGYRSGLNGSMVRHLQAKTNYLERKRPLKAGEVVIDIGSNDGTLLRSYRTAGIERIGIDPTGVKFAKYYDDTLTLMPEFFSAAVARQRLGDRKAAIITSIAMFYDLESPREFVADIASILADDGIWHFEQSYMPSMLRTNSYDTICHEHLEYYSLAPVKKLLEDAGLRICDVQMNAVNGGSFAVTACLKNSSRPSNDALIEWMLGQEERMGLSTPAPFREFEKRVFQHREDLRALIKMLRAAGKRILGYGASTKGNVLLQFCKFDSSDIEAIAEINEDKIGGFTPGTHIPIISEADAKAMNPDYFLVLPWHFRDGIVQREQEYLAKGGSMIFPLPEIEIVGG